METQKIFAICYFEIITIYLPGRRFNGQELHYHIIIIIIIIIINLIIILTISLNLQLVLCCW